MPAYNEAATVEAAIDDHTAVLKSLGNEIAGWEIVCLDDGSTDGTLKVLERMADRIPELRVERHQSNQGIFASFRDLYSTARGTHVYATASDGQWPASTLIGLVRAMKSEQADLVVAVRTNRDQVYGLWRRLISSGFNFLPWLLFGTRTGDAGSVKLGKSQLFRLSLVSRSPFGEAERIIVAHKRGYRLSYQPIEFVPRTRGKMSGARLSNVVGSLRDCLRCFLAYRLGWRPPNPPSPS